VFDFIKQVLNDRQPYPCYRPVEEKRKALLHNRRVIKVEDFGAGSAVIKTNKRVVADIASSSLKPKKYAQLLYRLVKHYQPQTMVELGTSFGISSAYLALGHEQAKLYTCEGSPEIAAIARKNFDELGLANIELVEGDFSVSLPPLLSKLGTIHFAFVDGNHRNVSTLDYFNRLLGVSKPATILVFDDIHWSVEMESAWAAIQQHAAVTVSIDLFFFGIVFLNTDFNHKQHFTIRF
jgi:predicted O-methyltransferase YrrM